MAEGTDRDLFEAWRAGDPHSGSALFARHFDSVYRFFSGRMTTEEDVADLVQRTFLACVERPVAHDAIRNFRAYLLGIAYKQMLMELRRRHTRRREAPAGSLQEELAQSEAVSIATAVADRERQRALLVALRRLSIDLQITLELHYWEGLSTEEIGRVLGISAGGVKTRLFTARKRLLDEMRTLAGADALADVSLRELGAWAASLRAPAE